METKNSVIYHFNDAFSRISNGRENEKIKGKAIILERKKAGKQVYLTVQDESGTTQLVVKKEQVDALDWDVAVSLTASMSIEFEGQTTATYLRGRRDVEGAQVSFANSVTVIVSTIRIAATEHPNADRGSRVLGLSSPVTQVYLAKLKQRISYELSVTEEFQEVDTRMISATPPRPGGVYPLQIHYDGYGAPFHVVPSPIPQLLQLLLSTQINDAFCIGRCFTQGYRDPIVSVESLIVSMVKRGTGVESLLRLSDTLLRKIISDAETPTRDIKEHPKTRVKQLGDLDAAGGAAVAAPEIQLFFPRERDTQLSEYGRLCWPRIAAPDNDFGEYVIAEGYTSGSKNNPAYSAITFNIDRLLTLCFEQIELRRIPSIQAIMS